MYAGLELALNDGEVAILSNIAEDHDFSAYDRIFPVGSKATRHIISRTHAHQKVYVSLVPRHTYWSILKDNRDKALVKEGRLTAVYIDQPVGRIIRLAKEIYPEAKVYASLFGPNSRAYLPDMQSTLKDAGLGFRYRDINQDDNPVTVIQGLVGEADIIIALPDVAMYNRIIAKWLLYIAFASRKPLIAFSDKYVDAGAAAAVFSTPSDIAASVLWVLKKTNSRLNVEGYFPKFFTVKTNKRALATLRIHAPSDEVIHAKIIQFESTDD
ncbi:hypothetical protein [Neptuniibacter sp. QD37_11]|uniref:hypothetical protein n=1 Tax=Neptuniibacter sp. QD37_11 TaxID=3398209 RepID=UPI0039F4AE1D